MQKYFIITFQPCNTSWIHEAFIQDMMSHVLYTFIIHERVAYVCWHLAAGVVIWWFTVTCDLNWPIQWSTLSAASWTSCLLPGCLHVKKICENNKQNIKFRALVYHLLYEGVYTFRKIELCRLVNMFGWKYFEYHSKTLFLGLHEKGLNEYLYFEALCCTPLQYANYDKAYLIRDNIFGSCSSTQ